LQGDDAELSNNKAHKDNERGAPRETDCGGSSLVELVAQCMAGG